MFQELRHDKESSPAVRLFTKYRQLTNSETKVACFRDLLQRGFTEQDVECVINWLAVHRAGSVPGSTVLLRNFKGFLAEAQQDPVACKLPVSIAARDLWERIESDGRGIDPEYVQAALDGYRAYLKSVEGTPVYRHMPPGIDFVYEWFVHWATHGSPRTRRFHAEHYKFVEYMKYVKRTSERA